DIKPANGVVMDKAIFLIFKINAVVSIYGTKDIMPYSRILGIWESTPYPHLSIGKSSVPFIKICLVSLKWITLFIPIRIRTHLLEGKRLHSILSNIPMRGLVII